MVEQKERQNPRSKLHFLVDNVQQEIEAAYGLDRKFAVADFLYPHSTSFYAAGKIARGGDNGFFITDLDFLPEENRLIWPQAGIGKLPLIRRLLTPALSRLHPVLYYRDTFRNRFERLGNLTAIARDGQLFQVLVEETSHAEFFGQQYETHGKAAGYVMAEGIAMLDIYTVYRVSEVPKEAKRRTDVLMDKRYKENNRARKYAERKFESLSSEYQEIHRKDFEAIVRSCLRYTRSVDLIRGLIVHISEVEIKSNDVNEKLGAFYLMSAKDQLNFLRMIYSGLDDARYIEAFERAVSGDLEFKRWL